jgi:hypothetical protein
MQSNSSLGLQAVNYDKQFLESFTFGEIRNKPSPGSVE